MANKKRKTSGPNDVVFPVMGPTGVGKSTFINNLLGRADAKVSDGFESCTADIGHYTIQLDKSECDRYRLPSGYSNKRLVLIDTPGFDDTNMSDSEILTRIADWLAESYSSNMKVGGVVYLYPIYPNRITRNDRSNLQVFEKICGQRALAKVTLATTRWSILPNLAVGERREDELKSKFWSRMASRGAKIERLDDNPKSAWSILQRLVTVNSQADMRLQLELAVYEKTIPQTAAAQALRQKLLDLLNEHDSGRGDPEELKAKAQLLKEEAEELKIPLLQRFLLLFS